MTLNQTLELLLFKEAMTYLQVSRSKLYRLLAAGEVQGFKAGNGWRFTREALDKAKEKEK